MTILFIVGLFFLGLVSAYLINFLSDILPLSVEADEEEYSLMPVCMNCHKNRSWKEFLFLRPCHHCNRNVPLRHWFVLTLIPILFFPAFYFTPQGLNPLINIGLLIYFSLVIIIDIEHRIVLRLLTVIGLGLALIAGVQMRGLTLSLLGCASGLFLMILIFLAGIIFSKWMEKRRGEEVDEALGAGDVYISAITGLIMGFPGVFSALLLAIVLGGLVSLIYVIKMVIRHNYQSLIPIPYTPFIILATVFLMYRI
ncbi:MAG: prepilin peptidase [Anaerolineae bacterium]|nr:prepilin peptidase [Anaerolineae bacterium]